MLSNHVPKIMHFLPIPTSNKVLTIVEYLQILNKGSISLWIILSLFLCLLLLTTHSRLQSRDDLFCWLCELTVKLAAACLKKQQQKKHDRKLQVTDYKWTLILNQFKTEITQWSLPLAEWQCARRWNSLKVSRTYKLVQPAKIENPSLNTAGR